MMSKTFMLVRYTDNRLLEFIEEGEDLHKKIVAGFVTGKIEKLHPATLKRLESVDLEICDEKGNLTSEAMDYALEFVSLEKQCEYLNIPVWEETIEGKGIQPEIIASDYFRRKGYMCSFSEGKVFMDLLESLWQSLETSSDTQRAVDLSIPVTFDTIIRSYEEITRGSYKATVPKSFLIALYKCLGQSGLRDLNSLLTNSLRYEIGWPDLTLIDEKNGKMILVEVKAKDSLTPSQIETIPKLIEKLKYQVYVAKVRKIKSKKE